VFYVGYIAEKMSAGGNNPLVVTRAVALRAETAKQLEI
jgi:hypothetical protein